MQATLPGIRTPFDASPDRPHVRCNRERRGVSRRHARPPRASARSAARADPHRSRAVCILGADDPRGHRRGGRRCPDLVGAVDGHSRGRGDRDAAACLLRARPRRGALSPVPDPLAQRPRGPRRRHRARGVHVHLSCRASPAPQSSLRAGRPRHRAARRLPPRACLPAAQARSGPRRLHCAEDLRVLLRRPGHRRPDRGRESAPGRHRSETQA